MERSANRGRKRTRGWARYGALSAWMALVALLGGCRSLQLDRSELRTEPGWLTEGETGARHNAVPEGVELPLAEAWSFNAGAAFGPGSPLVWQGVVLAANRKGEIHAIALETGKKLGMQRFGEAVEGTPVLGGDVLFVPIAWGGRTLEAYDLYRGRTLWKRKGVPFEAGLLYLDDTVVGVDVEGMVWAYDPADGAVRWQHAMGPKVAGKASPVAVGPHTVVVADDRGLVTALDVRDGTARWAQPLHTPVYATPATQDALVFLPTTRGRFFALDAATGAERWRYTIPDSLVRFTTPAVNGRDVVFGGSDGSVRMLDARTGAVRWTHEAGHAITAAPLLAENVVFVGSMGRMLYALDRRTGTRRWEQELEGRIKSAMALFDDQLVVLAEPRQVYLFKQASSDYAASK